MIVKVTLNAMTVSWKIDRGKSHQAITVESTVTKFQNIRIEIPNKRCLDNNCEKKL